jgi:WD40 repeat protein
MKSEAGAHRHTIATNSKYICYAVKGNLIRVINATTGDKLLLRGHSHPISDMQFSSADLNVLCSLQDQDGAGNIFVWKLSKEQEFLSTTLCQLPFTASCVHGHPLASTLWAVAHQNSLCLFSTLHPPKGRSSRLCLQDFAAHQSFAGEVVGETSDVPSLSLSLIIISLPQTSPSHPMVVCLRWEQILISLLRQSFSFLQAQAVSERSDSK